MSDVRSYLIERAAKGAADTEAAALVKARATKASAKASANRAEKAAATAATTSEGAP